METVVAPERRLVGSPLPRLEDERILRGQACYVDDLELPDLAHVAFARSIHAHARILGVDAARALAAPGVVAVLTAADLAGRVQELPTGSIEDMEVADRGHPVLAVDEVRYVGQPIAAVVAETRALAEDAAELVDVEYEPLPAVVDPRASEERLTSWSRTAGDVEGAFAAADRVVSRTFRITRLVAAPMEGRGAVAQYDADEDLLTVWCSAQDPHRQLAGFAHALARPAERIRVIVADTGGAFGSKGVIGAEHAALAVAAIDLRRPLKWVEDRLENFLASYQGRGEEVDLELALTDEGRMLALRAVVWGDLGAYLYASTAIPAHTTAKLLCGCYTIPVAAAEIRGMATHKVPTGPYRGAGRPEAAFAIEQLVDVAAAELGIDPVELRRRNLIRDFPYETALGWTYDSGDYERCLDLALELAGPERARDGDTLVGTGVALYVERSGGQWESAEVELARDGTVVVRSGSSPHGQGHRTTFAQIVADELGVEPAAVAFAFGDSAEVPAGVGTFASRSVAMGGSALLLALEEVRDRAREVAAGLLEVAPEEVAWDGSAFAADGRSVTLAEVAAAAPEPLRASTRFSSPLLFSSGAWAAVVAVDRATGLVRVRRLGAADDAGRIVNPLLAEGQVVGAAAQAIGECLTEEMVHDESGQPRTANFADYSLPTAAEVPEIASAFVESPTPHNPLGAKGIGEGGAIGAPPAIANALADALGGRRLDPPFTPAKVWRALQEEAPG